MHSAPSKRFLRIFHRCLFQHVCVQPVQVGCFETSRAASISANSFQIYMRCILTDNHSPWQSQLNAEACEHCMWQIFDRIFQWTLQQNTVTSHLHTFHVL